MAYYHNPADDMASLVMMALGPCTTVTAPNNTGAAAAPADQKRTPWLAEILAPIEIETIKKYHILKTGTLPYDSNSERCRYCNAVFPREWDYEVKEYWKGLDQHLQRYCEKKPEVYKSNNMTDWNVMKDVIAQHEQPKVAPASDNKELAQQVDANSKTMKSLAQQVAYLGDMVKTLAVYIDESRRKKDADAGL